MISDEIKKEKQLLNINENMKIENEKIHQSYMEYHRKNIFRDNKK